MRRIALASCTIVTLAAACSHDASSSFREPARAPSRVSAQSLSGAVRVEWEPVRGAERYALVHGTGLVIEVPAGMVAVTVTALAPHILHPFSIVSIERGHASALSAAVYARVLTGREVTVEPVFVTEPSEYYASLGGAIAPAGDVDLDGYPDFWAGIGPALMPGEARLFYGHPQTIVDHDRVDSIPGLCGTCEAGFQVATCDLDGDDRLDLLLVERRTFASLPRIAAYPGAAAALGTALAWTVLSPGGDPNAYDEIATGDVDGDGLDDVLTGMDAFNSNRGRADLFPGPGPTVGTAHTATWTHLGAAPADGVGKGVALGDADADGFADALVGASGEDGATVPEAGRVHLYFGSVAGLEAESAATFDGTAEEGGFGTALGMFDLDGDGATELVLADPAALEQRGRVCVHRVTAARLPELVECIEGLAEGDRFGAAVAAADVNGDGIDDLLVTAETPRTISVLAGTPGGVDPVPERVIEGRDAGGGLSFGINVVGLGDLDGDGLEEVAIGEPKFSTATIFFQGRLWTYHFRRVPDEGPRADAGLVAQAVVGAPFHPALAGAADPAGVPLSCAWSWGDGSAEAVIPVCTATALAGLSHVYANAGDFVLRLRAETADGRSAESVTRVFVRGTVE